MDNGGARGSSSLYGFLGIVQHSGRLHDVLDGSMQFPAWSSEIILEFDKNNGSR
jgi:hypothetical protein